jgi:hypothetical protein
MMEVIVELLVLVALPLEKESLVSNIGGWRGFGAGLDVSEKRKISCTCWKF